MQPNQPFNPTPTPNDEPTPAPSDWSNPPQSPQPTALPSAQPVAPQQPTADFARYQPQPVHTSPPAPIQPPVDAAAMPEQPVTQPSEFQATPQQPVTQSDPTDITDQSQPSVAPAPLSPFEQEYQAALQTPARKKSHLGLIITTIIAVLLLGGGAAAYMWMQDQNDPEKRFYRAIENHLTTTLIQQDYDQQAYNGGKMSATIQSTSDFTDPKTPKSYVQYELDATSPKLAFAAELVILDDKEYFAKLSKSADFKDQLGMGDVDKKYIPETNQWYRVDAGDFGGTMMFDPGSTTKQVNTPQGEVIVGNFNETTRADLMSFIKEKSLYTINSSKAVTVDGQKMTEYDITIKPSELNELNAKALKAIGISESDELDYTVAKNQKNTLWVSHANDRLVKAKMTRDSSDKKSDGSPQTDTAMVKISYPTNASIIAKPDGAREVPWPTE